jgi:hypothetical protein
MNCESVADRIPRIAAGSLGEDEQRACMKHIAACESCSFALQGATAMWTIRSRRAEFTPHGLFERVMASVVKSQSERSYGLRFWQGAGFGGAIAASLLALAIALGFLSVPEQPAVAEFYVSTEEARPLHVAIEADRRLDGAKISILLSGDVRIDGYRERRELVWTENLDAGVNQLTLPLVAIGDDGGQMVVRLEHPDSEQLFVVQLRSDG